MNIFFLENWQITKKIALYQNMKVSGAQKFQFFNSLRNWEKFWIHGIWDTSLSRTGKNWESN